MKLKHILFCSALLLTGTSCSDFLDKEPISDNVDEGFFTAETHLEPYCNIMYGLFIPRSWKRHRLVRLLHDGHQQ